MKKLSYVKKYFFEQLKGYYDYFYIREFFYFIMEIELSKNRMDIFLDMEEYEFSIDKINRYISGLKKNVPIQYLTRFTYFYGIKIKLNNKTFIPRKETEELVDFIIKSNVKKESILDICSGSGCIAISLYKNIKEAKVFAIEKFKDVIEIANENNDLNLTNVNFIELDIFKDKLTLNQKFDIIVSNPPYVTEDEKTEIEPNVLNYEPHSAIFVDEDPLIFYYKIIKISNNYLNKNGNLFFEINHKFVQQIENMLKENNFFNIIAKKDLNGKFRIIKATYAGVR